MTASPRPTWVPGAARIALLLTGLLVAWAAFSHAASETGVLPVGQGASGRYGLEAEALAKVVDYGFRTEAATRMGRGSSDLPQMSDPLVSLARASYAVDPLEVSSLRTIALGSVLQEDPGRARRLMRLAAQISKRDSVTNLWLAQDYGLHGDVNAMLASFDHALRTSRGMREVAMEPFVETIASEDGRIALGTLLAKAPEWEEPFWAEFARNPIALQHAANFLEQSAVRPDRIPRASRRTLYANLRQGRLFDSLERIAALDRRASATTKALAAGRIAAADEGNPLGWTFYSRGEFAARIQGQSGELQIDARAGSSGVAADRLVRLTKRHELEIIMADALPAHAAARLAVRCEDGSGRQLAIVQLEPGQRTGRGTFSAEDCEFATIGLSFTVDPGRRDALMRVASIKLAAL